MSVIRTARLTVAAAFLFALTACSAITNTSSGTSTNVAVNLSNAQAQAQATYQALQTEAKVMAASLSPAQQATVDQSLSALGVAVAAFKSVPSTTTVTGPSLASTVQSVLADAHGIIAILPLPPITQLAIQSGLLLINGLIAGIQSVPVTPAITAATTTTPKAAMTFGASIIHAPVSIPMAAPINIPLPNVH